jgi:RHS repeat-associated protein
VVGEYGADGSLIARYTHGIGLVSRTGAAGVAYYDFDAIGSTVGITSAAGSYVNSYSYLPFGETATIAAALPNPFSFVGQWGIQADTSDLFHMRARGYHAHLGQFLSDDPIGLSGGDLNLRRYVENAPTDLIDPSGLDFGVTKLLTDKLMLTDEEAHDYQNRLDDAKEEYYRTHPELVTERVRKELEEIEHRKRIGEHFDEDGALIDSIDYSQFDKKSTEVVGSSDPNDIGGSAGFGNAQFVRPEPILPYTIRFENDPQQATAPAQEVFITETLDADLDWNTFELGDIGFGSLFVDVPDRLQSYRTRLEYQNQDGTPLLVDFDSSLNLQTGVVTWTFRSVDPESGELPAGVFDGFLPVNDSSGRGEGFATYFVRPKADLATGTKIDAQASIVFDINAPVLTNIFTNTIDAGGPTSSVAPLAAADPKPVTVRWNGADDAGGSGIASYDIFVAVDGGPFTLWLDNTTALTAQYDGIIGHTYSFYSRATDNVGHVEAAPAAGDSSTLVVPPLEPGDYDRDKIVEVDDYNVWRSSFGQMGLDLPADGNEDGIVDVADYVLWRKYTWRIVHDPLGDYNLDGLINQDDYGLWRSTFGQAGQNLAADGNHDGMVDAADYAIWRARNRSIVIVVPAPGAASEHSADFGALERPSRVSTMAVDVALSTWPAQSPRSQPKISDTDEASTMRQVSSEKDQSLLLLRREARGQTRREPSDLDRGVHRVDDAKVADLDHLFAAFLDDSSALN